MTSPTDLPQLENFSRRPPAAAAADRSRTRNWCYTWNNYTDEKVTQLKSIQCKYHIMGFETAPDTGTRHIQGFIMLQSTATFNQIKAKLGDQAHIEKCNGSPWSNFEYCSKTTNFWEQGERPKQASGDKQKANMKKYQDACDLAKQGRIDEISPDLKLRHLGNILKLACLAKSASNLIQWADDDMKTHFFWLYGPTGTGKSHLARELANRIHPDRPPYLKTWNKWWDGYMEDDVVIIDEATPDNCKYLAGYCKQWIDKWTFRPEMKGGYMPVIRPEWIIITSNYSIEECFPAPADHEPLHRRLNTVYLDKRDETLVDTLLHSTVSTSQQLATTAQPTGSDTQTQTTRGGNTNPPWVWVQDVSDVTPPEVNLLPGMTFNDAELPISKRIRLE